MYSYPINSTPPPPAAAPRPPKPAAPCPTGCAPFKYLLANTSTSTSTKLFKNNSYSRCVDGGYSHKSYKSVGIKSQVSRPLVPVTGSKRQAQLDLNDTLNDFYVSLIKDT